MRDSALRDARDDQQKLETLHRLDEECVHQQRAGNYLKAFDCMERALVLRRHFFGIESDEVVQACRALAEMCNLLAMGFLQQDNYSVTIDLLKKADLLTQRHHPAERATTLNNFACYYRRLGKPHSAMTSLKRALDLEKRLHNTCDAADTQLNMCAVLSQLGRHQEALEQAQEALTVLLEELMHNKHTPADAVKGTTSSSRLDRVSVMCIAYHNVGVEQEFLKNFAESVASYKKGICLAEQYLGADHAIATTLRNSYLAAKRILASKAKSRVDGRGQQSPSKACARLFLSPRSGSHQMINSLAIEKIRQCDLQVLTPRSIVAALPPLEGQHSTSAKKTKKKKKKETDLSEVKSAVSPLQLTFNTEATEPKVKKLASITSPQTEVQTPPSRRKASSTKLLTIDDTSGETLQTFGDEQLGTVSTSLLYEGESCTNVELESQIEGVDDAALSSSDSVVPRVHDDLDVVAGKTEESLIDRVNQATNIDTFENSSISAQSDSIVDMGVEPPNERNFGMSDGVAELQHEKNNPLELDQQLEQRIPSPHAIRSVSISGDIADPVLNADYVLSTIVVKTDEEQEVDFHSSVAHQNENENVITVLLPIQNDGCVALAFQDDHAFASEDRSRDFSALDETQEALESEADISEDHAELTRNASHFDAVLEEKLDEVLDDDLLEANAMDDCQRSRREIAGEKLIDNIPKYLKAADNASVENAASIENSGIFETNELLETNLEIALEDNKLSADSNGLAQPVLVTFTARVFDPVSVADAREDDQTVLLDEDAVTEVEGSQCQSVENFLLDDVARK